MTSEYGTYRLTFEPPTDQITPGVEMTLSGEADVSQMLAMFESFLQAAGYILKGELQVVEPPAKKEFVPFELYDFGDNGFSFVGNPYAGTFANDTISSMGVDVKSFGDSMISSF